MARGRLALRRMRRHGSAYWDALDGHRVDHGAVGGGRAAVALMMVAALTLVAVLFAIGRLPG